jgi:hypothetical protein
MNRNVEQNIRLRPLLLLLLCPNTQADVLTGHNNNDHLYGLDGNDTLSDGKGNDWLEGGKAFDFLKMRQSANVEWRLAA